MVRGGGESEHETWLDGESAGVDLAGGLWADERRDLSVRGEKGAGAGEDCEREA